MSIGLLTFEMLEYGLKRAKESDEPAYVHELAETVMKLSETLNKSDEFWSALERAILEILIKDELKSGSEPSFVNICNAAVDWQHLDKEERLKNIVDWVSATEAVKENAIAGLQARLQSGFGPALSIARHLKKAKAV